MTQELTGSPGAGGQGTSVPGGWRAMGLQAPCLHPCQALSSLESRGSAGNLLALLLVSKQAGAPPSPPRPTGHTPSPEPRGGGLLGSDSGEGDVAPVQRGEGERRLRDPEA